jgi:HK97 family phage major capsid protein
MEQKDLDTIKGAIAEGVKPLKDEVDAAVKEVKDRLAKIEALPLNKLGVFNVNTIPTEYRGYKLNEQGLELRDFASKNPTRFKVFNNEEKMNGFCKWMIAFIKAKKGDVNAQAELREMYQKAQMQEDTSDEGGYLVPQEYDWDIVQLARAKSFALDACSVINMTRDILNIPAEATMVSVAWTAEESGATETEPTFGTVQLNSKKLDGYGKVTNELLQDSAIDIVGMLTEQFAYAIGQELDNQVLNGTGSPVSGVMTAACGYSVVLNTGSSNFSAVSGTDFSNAIYKLNSGDLSNARFVIGRLIMHYTRTLKDANGNFIFASVGGATGGTIWGFPYFVSEKATNTTGASTAFGVFGDFKKFYIGRRVGTMSIDLDPYTYFKENATQFRIITRWGMAIGRSTAFARMLTSS